MCYVGELPGVTGEAFPSVSVGGWGEAVRGHWGGLPGIIPKAPRRDHNR